MSKKKIIVSVSNDLTNDQRVHRICSSLHKMDFEVLLIGRKLKNSNPIPEAPYKSKRLRLLFNKGIFFYLCLNTRLFYYLLFSKVDILLSNDLDTLLANTLAAKLKGKKLVYDSHELFTEVPELEDSNTKKNIWLAIEKACITKADKQYTVCDSIAKFYNEKYSIGMSVIRNLPISKPTISNYSERKNILIYQGALNKERGLETLIEAMQHIEDYKLLIAGKGDLEGMLQELTSKLGLTNKIEFTGNLSFDKLYNLTKTAKLGFSIETGTSLNYRYALPNKIFDYIQAGVPVLCADFPEMKIIIDNYKVGETFTGKTAKELSEKIKNLLNNKENLITYHNNCITAAKELNWKNEEQKLKRIFNSYNQ